MYNPYTAVFLRRVASASQLPTRNAVLRAVRRTRNNDTVRILLSYLTLRTRARRLSPTDQ